MSFNASTASCREVVPAGPQRAVLLAARAGVAANREPASAANTEYAVKRVILPCQHGYYDSNIEVLSIVVKEVKK